MVASTKVLTSGDGTKWSNSRSLRSVGCALWMDCMWSIERVWSPVYEQLEGWNGLLMKQWGADLEKGKLMIWPDFQGLKYSTCWKMLQQKRIKMKKRETGNQ